MIKLSFISFLVIITVATLVFATKAAGPPDLKGQLFEITREEKDCEVIAKCECCTAELFFLTGDEFAFIDYCHYENLVKAGTYNIISDSLILTFEQKEVILGVKWSGLPKDTISDIYLKEGPKDLEQLVFKLGKCDNGELMLQHKAIENYKVGLRTKFNDEAERFDQLLTSKEWALIKK